MRSHNLFHIYQGFFHSVQTSRRGFSSHQLRTQLMPGLNDHETLAEVEQMKRAPHEHFWAIIVQLYWSGERRGYM